MKNLINILIFGMVLFNFIGCFGLKGRMAKNNSAEQILGLPGSEEKAVLIIAGFNLLEDKRQKEDISYMTSVREKVSEKILNTLRDCRLFSEINFPPTENDNIIVSGEIRDFSWKSFDTMISYIPGLNVLPFFGLPSTRVRSEVEIYLEFKNSKTSEVILSFSELYKKDRQYNIYNFTTDKADKELASCFDVVLDKIKQKIALNKIKILETAKVEATKVEPPKVIDSTQETKQKDDTKIIEPQEQKQEQKQEQDIIRSNEAQTYGTK